MKALFPYLIPISEATRKHKYANEMLEIMAGGRMIGSTTSEGRCLAIH
jgi:hypothetical protein